MDRDSLLKEFLIESFENLSNLDGFLTKLEQDPGEKNLINEIYRTAHTLKGSANFLGLQKLQKLQKLTHITENLLDQIREKK
ncbi:MAG: hypothetical protein HOE90_07745 [Bacteriovoracaceae bacterium]|jgi:two-component system, chemotaxis family, sensor kinase CheA|nr:hypothetical protein [Bacteriovoracaceae bacterium]